MAQAQVVLEAQLDALAKASKKHPPHILFSNNLFILPILVAASVLVFLLTWLVPKLYRFVRKRIARRNDYEAISSEDEDAEEVSPRTPTHLPSHGLASDFRAHIRSLRDAGSVLFALETLRTLALCALLGLSIWAAIQAETPMVTSLLSGTEENEVEASKKHWGKKKKHKGHHDKSTFDQYSSLEWGEFGMCGFYTYTLLLSLLLLTLRPATPLRRQLITHLDVLLFLAFALYAYRDFWPMITTYLAPVDLDIPSTWSRLVILTIAAALIPLVRPRTYVPADSQHPTPPGEVHPEQTSPWLFYVFYEYMTPLVWKAWRTPSLPYDDLHPLADYDRAEHLYHLHIPHLDPLTRKQQGKKPRHLASLLLYIFKGEALTTCLMCALAAVAELASPVGIQQLLSYLESDGKGSPLKPIFWIGILFFGPLVSSLAIQWYIYVMTRCLVRGEAILTQLLFDHALRLRMKDSTDEDEKLSDNEQRAHKNGNGHLPAITVEEIVDHAPGITEDLLQDVSEDDEAPKDNGHADGNGNGSHSEATEVGTANGSTKGQGAEQKPGEKGKDAASGQGIAGKINVLMAADVESVVEGRDIPLVLVFAPIQLALCVVFLYRVLSWSAFIGMLTMVITLPLPGLLTKKNAEFQQKRMLATDARIDVITEAVGALRMLKMFAWEDRMKHRIAVKREQELTLIWQRRLMSLLTVLLNIVLPVLTMAVTFLVYTVVQKRQLTAATVFSSMTVFELLKGQMGMVFYLVNGFVTAAVSVNRINKFLHSSEMVDEYTEGKTASIKTQPQLEAESEGLIRLHDAVFTWGSANGKATPGFRLTIPEVTFEKGKINLITGPTGSGKSSLLKALVGELHFLQKNGSFFHLPREGGVSYAAQESWCMSESIKVNILFGEPYDEERYRKTIMACGLEPDLKLLDDGDETEIGEKGVTLSGGQKARITLARAVYCKTDVVLLDDIFSALDTLTSRWIIDNLFKGDLMYGRTVLLVTHHVHLVAPMADFIVGLNEDGSVRTAGPVEDVELSDDDVEEAVEEIKERKKEDELPKALKTEEQKKGSSKLVQAEEKAEGRISRQAMFSFFRQVRCQSRIRRRLTPGDSTFGGPVFWSLYFGLILAGQGMSAFQTYWLGRWARAYDEVDDPRDVSVAFWLGLYFGFVLIGLFALGASAVLFYVGAIKASRDIHRRLVDRIFASYMRFLDSTPVGRIVSRFTKDMKSIDGMFTETFASVMDMSVGLIIKFFVVITLVPLFSLPAIAIGVLGGILGELYMHGQLSVKREMSNAKSPLFSHFAAAVNGIVSIRAYGAQEKLRAEARRRADKYTRAATAFYNLNRWVTVRIDMLGGLFAAALASFLVYGPRLDASTAGFALSQAISFSATILWWVRMVNQMEVEGNSVERIQDYLVIDQEPASVPEKEPPAAWPTSGEIVLDKLSAKYSQDGPTVLDNLQVTIKSGEKVGIVGRTGSGKSTLALALLRMIPTTGSVIIDGVKTERINLHALRSDVTIIPQDPILLSGSLRFNLDPFGDHDDAELNDALQSSGLGAIRHSGSGVSTPQRLTLDYQISAGGSNLSQGQRQLVALARALVRNSKVFILDEATASVDFETDALIQQSIRNLPKNTTVLTVAHRLATVMDYDKILVLGAGKLLEFDSPDVLKSKKDSYFAKLVQAMEG